LAAERGKSITVNPYLELVRSSNQSAKAKSLNISADNIILKSVS